MFELAVSAPGNQLEPHPERPDRMTALIRVGAVDKGFKIRLRVKIYRRNHDFLASPFMPMVTATAFSSVSIMSAPGQFRKSAIVSSHGSFVIKSGSLVYTLCVQVSHRGGKSRAVFHGFLGHVTNDRFCLSLRMAALFPIADLFRYRPNPRPSAMCGRPVVVKGFDLLCTCWSELPCVRPVDAALIHGRWP